MSSSKVVLFTSKKLKNGEHPIMLRVIKDRKPKYLSIGASCSKEMWDEKENLPKKKHKLFNELKVLIDKKQFQASKLLLSLNSDDKDYSAEEVKHKLIRRNNHKKTVFTYFGEIVTRLEQANRIGYSNIFQSTKKSLEKFRGGKDFSFSDVNTAFLVKYEDFLSGREVSPNGIFVYMRTFKTLINYAKRDNVVLEDFDPFKEFSFTKYRRIKTKKRAISKEQIQKFIDQNFEPETSLFHSKNYFLFSYYNRGINFIDMAFLKWENIKNGRLDYVRRKSKERFTIGMLEPAIKILEYYRKNYYESEDGYIFPILNKTHITARGIDNRIDKVLKTVNKDLKTIAKEAKIDEKLTTYVARHSYATIMKRSGISTSIISEAMGHESEKTTQIYLDTFENHVLDEASKIIL